MNNIDGSEELNLKNVTSGYIHTGSKQLESVKHTDDGKIEVIYIIRNDLTTWPPSSMNNDRAIKEIYIAHEGKIILAEAIEGEVIPPQTTPEKIKWAE